MDLKRIAKDTSTVLTSYLTFQAVKTVMNQIRETNPPLAYWFNAFSTKAALQDGEAYLRALMKENAELAIRVMTVRQHIADEVCEYLPEMVITGIQQANMEHRRLHLEYLTQLDDAEHTVETEISQESAADADSSTD
jgi:hypothetical protein